MDCMKLEENVFRTDGCDLAKKFWFQLQLMGANWRILRVILEVDSVNWKAGIYFDFVGHDNICTCECILYLSYKTA